MDKEEEVQHHIIISTNDNLDVIAQYVAMAHVYSTIYFIDVLA
jgi:hypothetical protein